MSPTRRLADCLAGGDLEPVQLAQGIELAGGCAAD